MIETIQRALRARASSSVEADARAMDHRAHVAGPPPPRQPVPVITAAPSVEGSAGKLGCYSEGVKDFFLGIGTNSRRTTALGPVVVP